MGAGQSNTTQSGTQSADTARDQGDEWKTEGHPLIGREIIRLVEGGPAYSEGKVTGWLSAAESDFVDDKGQPAALFHVQYTAGALVGDQEDLELHEVEASIKVLADIVEDTTTDAAELLKRVTAEKDALKDSLRDHELREALQNHDHRRGREKAQGTAVQIRSVGDTSFRTFATQSDADMALGLGRGTISRMLNRSCKDKPIVELRKTIEVKKRPVGSVATRLDCTIVDKDRYHSYARTSLGLRDACSKRINLFALKTKYVDPRALSLLSRIAASSQDEAVVSARAEHRRRGFVPQLEGFTDDEVTASLGKDVSAADALLWSNELGDFVALTEELKGKLARGDLDAVEVEKLAEVQKLMFAHFRLVFWVPGRCVGRKFRLFHLCKGDVRLLYARLMSMDLNSLANLSHIFPDNHRSWSEDEEDRLRALVGELGAGSPSAPEMPGDETWAAIASRLGTQRTAVAVKVHWQLIKPHSREKRARDLAGATPTLGPYSRPYAPRKRGRVADVVEPSRGRSSSRRKRSSK